MARARGTELVGAVHDDVAGVRPFVQRRNDLGSELRALDGHVAVATEQAAEDEQTDDRQSQPVGEEARDSDRRGQQEERHEHRGVARLVRARS